MSAYLKFLSHTEQHQLSVDLTALRLLEIIATCAAHEALTVTECMDLQEIASPATLHRKLDDLRKAGLIYHQYEGENRRTKYLFPTQKALNHFNTLSQALLTVAEEHGVKN
jgi:DNA-binding MarR family transcriptional regulator